MEKKFQVELVWNREFHFVAYGQPKEKLRDAIAFARACEEMGDGERVKKTRVVDDCGDVVWQYGRILKPQNLNANKQKRTGRAGRKGRAGDPA